MRRLGIARWQDVPGRLVTLAILTIAALAIAAPFLWILRGAISPTDGELVQLPPTLPDAPTVANFGKVFDQVPFGKFVLNSLIVAGTITAAQLFTCSTAAYAFARLRFRGRGLAFAVVIASLLIPVQVTIVPLFLVMAQLDLTNTLWALILPPVFSAFGIFFLRQHLMSIPRELDEAATIDGAGHGQIFFRILMPLSAPALATLGILAFTYWWNDLLLPLVMINDTQTQTLPAGLVLLAGRFSTGSLTTIAAGITMAVVPVLIVFVVLQRYIVQSIAASGMKL